MTYFKSALIILLGPAIFAGVVFGAMYAIGWVWELLCKFQYWWQTFGVVGYLVFGVFLLGMWVSMKEESRDEQESDDNRQAESVPESEQAGANDRASVGGSLAGCEPIPDTIASGSEPLT